MLSAWLLGSVLIIGGGAGRLSLRLRATRSRVISLAFLALWPATVVGSTGGGVGGGVGEATCRIRGMMCPSVVKTNDPLCVWRKLSESNSRNRYLRVSARKKDAMWSSCVCALTDLSAAKPEAVRVSFWSDATISAPIRKYASSEVARWSA